MVAYLLVLPLGRGEESQNLRVTYDDRGPFGGIGGSDAVSDMYCGDVGWGATVPGRDRGPTGTHSTGGTRAVEGQGPGRVGFCCESWAADTRLAARYSAIAIRHVCENRLRTLWWISPSTLYHVCKTSHVRSHPELSLDIVLLCYFKNIARLQVV